MGIYPASFPSSKLGYNAYVKALGFDPKQQDLCMYVISLSSFLAVERRTDDQIKADELAHTIEFYHKAYDRFIAAIASKDHFAIELAQAEWAHWHTKRQLIDPVPAE